MSTLNPAFPKAILHVDGDAFFASCEMALDHRLKGKAIVTGQERGIATAVSYPAKALGIKRGMRIVDIRRQFPQVIIATSHYHAYGIFSRRMYAIVRRYTNHVEEYSIDECFADLTGLEESMHMSYADIALRIQNDLERELGMTFSVGVGPTKVIAKVASKWNKPSGLTCIPISEIETYLAKVPIKKVWGIGPRTAIRLERYGIHTALEFIHKDANWVMDNLSRPFQELWYELQGTSIYHVTTGLHDERKSVQRTRTFHPPSSNRTFVFAQLSKNIESLCAKLRRHGLVGSYLFIFLKTQQFKYRFLEIKLETTTSIPQPILTRVEQEFDKIFKRTERYRSTGISMMNLRPESETQTTLFNDNSTDERMSKVLHVADILAQKYGSNNIFFGSSFQAEHGRQFRELAIPIAGETH